MGARRGARNWGDDMAKNGSSIRYVLIGCMALTWGCGGGIQQYNPARLGSTSRPGSAEVPQECGESAGWGSLSIGSLVVLRAHRAVEGDRNWVAGMRTYANRTTRVTARSGRDPLGCPMVRVAIDGGRYDWRVRDLTFIGRGLGPGGGDASPQRCNQAQDAADVGLIQPGAEVIVWRHRTVDGETNWTAEMSQHVGEVATVTEVGGLDAEGCPIFHINHDDGEWAWRTRDTTLVRAALPQSCGQSDDSRDHGAITVGARVRLGHHRLVDGERNWTTSQEQYVDRLAEVTSLGPLDDSGCPIVHVDIDQGARPWRVRDLVLLEGSDPSRAGSARSSGGDIPQTCSQRGGTIDFGPIRIGTRIVLGRHRAVDGDANWSAEMEPFVGREATVTRLSGADALGCPGIRVDTDEGENFWRIRDVRLAE